MEMKDAYYIGKRDALAEVLMMARANGPIPTLRFIADELLKHDPDHPHAKWVLENIDSPK